MNEKSSDCPICSRAISSSEVRSGRSLLDSYESFFGIRFEPQVEDDYFSEEYSRHECNEDGLRFFSPPNTGDSHFYFTLSQQASWYYSAIKWDKEFAIRILHSDLRTEVTDYGCGDGSFLEMARRSGISGNGIDLSATAVEKARNAGFDCRVPSEDLSSFHWAPTVTLFQTLEHVEAPVRFLSDIAAQSSCRRIIISVPTFESLLGYSDDPLSWPPHHTTMWSGRALRNLASKIGFTVTQLEYEPLSFGGFLEAWSLERRDRLPGPFRLRCRPSENRIRWIFAKYLSGRILMRDWALRRHSVLAVFERV